jgi:trigger factor
MQVFETSNEGLKRQLKVVVGASEIGERYEARVGAVKNQIQIKGFRPGKVPVAHIKKVYGRSLMAEVLQQAIEDTSRQALSDRNERPALQPKIDLPEAAADIEQVIAGKSDLAYNMTFEVLPEIALADLAQLKLERLVADVEPAEIDRALDGLIERNLSYVAEADRAGGDKDRMTLDFVGRIDGEPFEGGTGEGVLLVLGQGNFIPGFEDGLTGAKAGDTRLVKATFPAAYPVETLRGKEAEFDVTVKEVARPERPALDDAFAKSLGAEDLAKLRELVTQQIQREHDGISNEKLKRQLLDALDAAHTFALPPSLVEAEYEGIWKRVDDSMKQAGQTFPHEGKSEDEAKVEYRRIAERRVRLGLVLGEIGDKNKIQVSQDEMRRALIDQARKFPGQERMVYDYFEKNPAALSELRAPVFEQKVVDFVVELARPAERKVSTEELVKPLADTI